MNLLFDIPTQEKEKPANKCKSCESIYRHEYSKNVFYCKKRKQKNTAYGHKKIHANDTACSLFKKETPNQYTH